MMLKIRKEVDLEILRDTYGFKLKKEDEAVFLLYTDENGNELIIYPFADGLIQILINVEKKLSNSLVDISQSGVSKKLERLIRENKLYIQQKEK